MPSRDALPYVDPRAPRGPMYRAYVRFLGTRLAAWLSRNVVWKIDPHLMRLTGGRGGLGLMLPTALLETRGARTGRLRRNGVIYFHDGERVTIIASKLGAPEHPSWFHNARANPDIQLGGQPFRVEVVDDEPSRARGSGSWLTASSRHTRPTEREPTASVAPSRSFSSFLARPHPIPAPDGRALAPPLWMCRSGRMIGRVVPLQIK